MYVLLSLALPLLVQSQIIDQVFLPIDCQDIFNNGSIHSGVYTIFPAGSAGEPVQVYCDMGCDEDGSHGKERWTVSETCCLKLWFNNVIIFISVTLHLNPMAK